MKDIIITLPQIVKWQDYQKELDAVADGTSVLNFRVPSLPKESGIGARCYLAHKGFVVGYMLISGFVESTGFTCQTTGAYWEPGKYLQRTGAFVRLPEQSVPQKGFQGWHYYLGQHD